MTGFASPVISTGGHYSRSSFARTVVVYQYASVAPGYFAN